MFRIWSKSLLKQLNAYVGIPYYDIIWIVYYDTMIGPWDTVNLWTWVTGNWGFTVLYGVDDATCNNHI